MVQTRGRQQQQTARKELMLGLAKDSMSLLLELGYVINQCYGNRPPHETQRALRRKNELVGRLETFVGSQQSGSREEEEEDNTSNAQERERLQASVERLQKQLLDQSAQFEQERARLQQQATVTLNAQSELNSSLNRVLPQLRGLLDAYERERGQHVDLTQDSAAAAACAAASTRTVTLTQSPNCTRDLTQRLTQLQTEFDAERALLLEQASDAANTQQDISRRNLTQREAALTCPISLDLFENPVVTECCGKTFSSEALNQALRRSSQCPVCRAHRVVSHANRDMANLVELHRLERSLLGLPDTAAASATPAADARAVTEERATEATESSTQLRQLAAAARQSQSRNQRNQRVQARAAVPHRPSSTTTQSNTTLTSTPPGSNRGRRRGGRNSNPRRPRSSRTGSSPTPSASSRASGAQSTPSAQSWSYDSRPSTASAAAPASSIDYSYIRSWVPRDVGSSSYRSAPSSNTAPTQSSTSTGYNRAPLDDGFNPYPYGYGYFDSDSDY